jgi:histidinol-phosphate aminotransferase
MTVIQPRPGVLDIEPYIGGESVIPGVNRVIKLASNESALGPSPRAVEALHAAAATIHRYPDGSCQALREALAARHRLDAARIVCGAGSDELIALLCRAYLGPGDEMLYTEHGFLMYAIAARAAGATPVVAAETDLTADVNALLARVSERTRIVFLANPNNPTGSYLPAVELERLRAALPPEVLLVLDLAYAEYIDQPDYDDGFALVEAGENVVVTRTFSKIYGLGGVRLGWAYCGAAVADVLNRVRNPFNVASPAQAAGLAALDDEAFITRAKAHNGVWREWTTTSLRALGLTVPASFGNFVLVRFPTEAGHDAVAADAYLRSRGIIARRMAAYRLPDALRITIGREDEMREAVAALGAFMSRR